MRLIALDTATGPPTLCLRIDARVAGRWSGPARAEPHLIADAAVRLLAEHGLAPGELDAIAYGRGPGAFTGVRLAVALAQGLALGAGLPVAGVSDLAALAWRAGRRHGWRRVIACLDARQGEVYWGAFVLDDAGLPAAATAECVAPPQDVQVPPGEWTLAGSGAPLPGWSRPCDPDLAPDAEAVAVLAAALVTRGGLTAAEAAAPCYLRERVATPSPRRHNAFLT